MYLIHRIPNGQIRDQIIGDNYIIKTIVNCFKGKKMFKEL